MTLVTLTSDTFVGNKLYPSGSTVDIDPSVLATRAAGAPQLGAYLKPGDLPIALSSMGVTLSKLTNATQANTMNLRAMMGGSLNADKRGRLLVFSDSSGAGTGANNQTSIGCRAKAYPSVMAGVLNKTLPALTSSMAADSGYGITANAIAYDPRITITGAAGIFPNTATLGGTGIWTLPSGTAGVNKVQFTPGFTFDRVWILVDKVFNANPRSLVVSVDGGTTAAATIVTNDVTGLLYQVINVTPGSTVVTVQNNQVDSYFSMMGVFTSTAPSIEVINGGVSGVKLDTLMNDASAYRGILCAEAILDNTAFNVTLLEAGANDLIAGGSVDALNANIAAAITRLKAKGDVIVCTYGNLSPTYSQSLQDSVNGALIAGAIAQGVPYFDTRTIMPDYATANAAGLFFDSLHYRGTGHGMIGRGLAQALVTI